MIPFGLYYSWMTCWWQSLFFFIPWWKSSV